MRSSVLGSGRTSEECTSAVRRLIRASVASMRVTPRSSGASSPSDWRSVAYHSCSTRSTLFEPRCEIVGGRTRQVHVREVTSQRSILSNPHASQDMKQTLKRLGVIGPRHYRHLLEQQQKAEARHAKLRRARPRARLRQSIPVENRRSGKGAADPAGRRRAPCAPHRKADRRNRSPPNGVAPEARDRQTRISRWRARC